LTDDLPPTTFTGLAQRTGLIPDAELDDFWATLEPASICAPRGDGRLSAVGGIGAGEQCVVVGFVGVVS